MDEHEIWLLSQVVVRYNGSHGSAYTVSSGTVKRALHLPWETGPDPGGALSHSFSLPLAGSSCQGRAMPRYNPLIPADKNTPWWGNMEAWEIAQAITVRCRFLAEPVPAIIARISGGGGLKRRTRTAHSCQLPTICVQSGSWHNPG